MILFLSLPLPSPLPSSLRISSQDVGLNSVKFASIGGHECGVCGCEAMPAGVMQSDVKKKRGVEEESNFGEQIRLSGTRGVITRGEDDEDEVSRME